MPTITTRSARAEDVTQLHPEARGASYLAWVAELNGRPDGTIGLALTRPRACLFCRFDETLRPHLKAMPLLRLLKRVQTTIETRARPVYALRDPREEQAPAILARLGFALVGWSGGDEVWEWGGWM
jgi:hypothetical protein